MCIRDSFHSSSNILTSYSQTRKKNLLLICSPWYTTKTLKQMHITLFLSHHSNITLKENFKHYTLSVSLPPCIQCLFSLVFILFSRESEKIIVAYPPPTIPFSRCDITYSPLMKTTSYLYNTVYLQ